MDTLLQSEPVAKKIEKLSPTKEQLITASDVALALGFASILGSIITWFFTKPKDRAHSERFGIFVGLWVPTFFILANHLARRAEYK